MYWFGFILLIAQPPDFFRLRRKTPQKIRLRRGLLSFFEQLSFEIPGSRTAGGRMLLNEKPNASALTEDENSYSK